MLGTHKQQFHDLNKNGFVVLRVDWMTFDWREQARADFRETLQSIPEFTKDHTLNDAFVLGGFAALGNPSSFHNPFVRRM